MKSTYIQSLKSAVLGLLLCGSLAPQCLLAADNPRNVLFIGVDVSGSFINGKYYEDSIQFIATYLYSHLRGLGGLEVPKDLFVGTIGGAKPNEPKTFYPIQSFQDKSVTELITLLHEIFPQKKQNKFTDFNAYFEQVFETVRNRKLILRPISIVLFSDGIPDAPLKRGGTQTYGDINVNPLENLSRNITIRLLYTDAVTGQKWQNLVKRRRVKLWTQDAAVMVFWKDPKIFHEGMDVAKQDKFFSWVKDNVDFGVRGRTVP
ncbi:MAG: hypothetical protein AABZ55_05040 [Bdellovibrionota bacterium]